jgi:hypothetical protein
MGDDHDHGHDVHFESADAGASLTYPQQAGTVRKNGFLVIKGRPCKVCLAWYLCRPCSLCHRMQSCCSPYLLTASNVKGVRNQAIKCIQILVYIYLHPIAIAKPCLVRPWTLLQVADVSTSKTGKHGHAKCHFVAIDIFTGKKYEDLTPSSHNCDVRLY